MADPKKAPKWWSPGECWEGHDPGYENEVTCDTVADLRAFQKRRPDTMDPPKRKKKKYRLRRDAAGRVERNPKRSDYDPYEG